MSLGCVTLLLVAGICLGGVMGHPERPPLTDSGKARELFRLVESTSARKDGRLGEDEVDQLFEAFDLDGDHQIEAEEFVSEWRRKGLGAVERAGLMFRRVDTDGDGVITRFPDVSRVFRYFDIDGDGEITEMEYIIVWNSLSS